MTCAELERELFPQCEDRDRLAGYVIGNHRGEFFVDTSAHYRDALGFFVEAVDEEYSDELGGAQLQILGVARRAARGPMPRTTSCTWWVSGTPRARCPPTASSEPTS